MLMALVSASFGSMMALGVVEEAVGEEAGVVVSRVESTMALVFSELLLVP
jgi:hypothetical protein